MLDIVIDTLLDLAKLLPFLFITFLIIELLEDKISKKSKDLVSNTSFLTTIFGSLFGIVPQCGFSVMATNLYTTRIINLSTLIAIYLSTSDEMLPLLISSGASINEIIKILSVKLCISLLFGLVIFFVDKRTFNADYSLCEKDHCDCEHKGALAASLKHTLKTAIYLLVITFVINIAITYVGEDIMEAILLKDTLFAPILSALVGLIPNCATSLLITQLYLDHMISFASCIAGLLSNSGIAILVLFRNNKNIKENLTILALLYGISAISGIVIELMFI